MTILWLILAAAAFTAGFGIASILAAGRREDERAGRFDESFGGTDD